MRESTASPKGLMTSEIGAVPSESDGVLYAAGSRLEHCGRGCFAASQMHPSRGKRRIVPGIVEAWIGGGQPVPRSGLAKTSGVVTKFAILGEATLPD